MQRSITILGRKEGEQHDFAKLIYPAMQAADIFALGVHIAQAGMDQRKAHVVARDVATKMRINPLRDASGTTPSSRWPRTSRCSPGCSSRTAGRCRRRSGPRRWRR